ncbi:hypothetical protein BDV19DRAFT_370631 [Aspergillus venezuelensis]
MEQITGLKHIGGDIYLHEPPTASDALIILCTWIGGATPRRVSKYTNGYKQGFPRASILLIPTSIPDITIRTFNAVQSRLSPAREVITRFLDYHFTPTSKPRPVLLHMFSNGGCNIGVQLVRSVMMHNEADHLLLLSALRLVVFDCCPGDSSFQRTFNAAVVSLPSVKGHPIVHAAGRSVLYPVIGTILGLERVGLIQSLGWLRLDLNKAEVFGGSARRLYVYSTKDEIVRWEDVEEHLENGRSRGYCVVGVRFDTGQHCALVAADEEVYWRSIQQAWDGTIKSRL